MPDAVWSGLGVAVLPTCAAAVAARRPVMAVPLSEPQIARDIVMIRASEHSMKPALGEFEKVLRRAGAGAGSRPVRVAAARKGDHLAQLLRL